MFLRLQNENLVISSFLFVKFREKSNSVSTIKSMTFVVSVVLHTRTRYFAT